MNKKIIIGIVSIVLISAFIYLYFFPNIVYGCLEIQPYICPINPLSGDCEIKYNLYDRTISCNHITNDGTKYGGYKSFEECMYNFQEFARSSPEDTGSHCSKRGIILFHDALKSTQAEQSSVS